LHVERCVAGSNGMIFKSNGRPEAGHDPIAFFAGHPPIVVNDVDHGVDGRLQDPASVLRITVINQRCRTRNVGEENGYNLAFTLLRVSNLLDKTLWCPDSGRNRRMSSYASTSKRSAMRPQERFTTASASREPDTALEATVARLQR
jgi:hypothetical protein